MNNNELLKMAEALLDSNVPAITKLANISALVYHNLEDLNWLGFYLKAKDKLVLGPFQGKVACEIIPFDKGICGRSYRLKEASLINDVHKEKDHIACDSASNSELVVPIIKDNEVLALLDIDSPKLNRFTKNDLELMIRMADLIIKYIDFKKISDLIND